MIDRDRLRQLLQRGTDEISSMADQAIAAKVPSMVPPAFLPMVRLLSSQVQTRPTISAAATRLVDELTDEEWRSLLTWIVVETIDLLVPVEDREALTLTERASYALSGLIAVPPTGAIDHARRILAE